MALLLGMAMLPAGAIAIQVGLNAVSVRQAAYEETLNQRALQAATAELGMVDEVRELIRVLSTSPALSNLEARACRTWLDGVMREYTYVLSISITSEQGRVICSVPELRPGTVLNSTDFRQRAQARDDLTMGYVYGQLTRQPVVGALGPLRDERGRRTGFVGVAISPETLRDVLERDQHLEAARTGIVDSTGRVIVETAPRDGSKAPPLPSSLQLRGHLNDAPSYVQLPGGSAVAVPLHAPDLYAVTSWAPDQPAWRRWSEIAFTIAAPLLIWLLAVAAGWFAIEIYVARPLSALETMARRYARGEEVGETPDLVSAPIEIRSLRRTLAAMAKTLRGREARLVEALGEERALLREVHHRVKNNLQMVASLLNIQARSARDDSEAWGLARAHDRVQLLALVHQRIYASGAVREIMLDDIAAEITRQLLQSRSAQARSVTLHLHLAEAKTDADRAVPMAFLIGEAFSNALDAVAEAETATLNVFLAQDESGAVRFVIDGETQGAAVDPTMGSRLIDAFARQLGAQIGRVADRPFMIWAYVPPARTQE